MHRGPDIQEAVASWNNTLLLFRVAFFGSILSHSCLLLCCLGVLVLCSCGAALNLLLERVAPQWLAQSRHIVLNIHIPPPLWEAHVFVFVCLWRMIGWMIVERATPRLAKWRRRCWRGVFKLAFYGKHPHMWGFVTPCISTKIADCRPAKMQALVTTLVVVIA